MTTELAKYESEDEFVAFHESDDDRDCIVVLIEFGDDYITSEFKRVRIRNGSVSLYARDNVIQSMSLPLNDEIEDILFGLADARCIEIIDNR